MQTKSNIQILRETQDRRMNFFEALRDLVNKYEVENNIFCEASPMEEPTQGYFIPSSKTYESIEDAFKNLCPGGAIQVKKNVFIPGEIVEHYSDIPSGTTVVDLHERKMITV